MRFRLATLVQEPKHSRRVTGSCKYKVLQTSTFSPASYSFESQRDIHFRPLADGVLLILPRSYHRIMWFWMGKEKRRMKMVRQSTYIGGKRATVQCRR